MSPRGNAGRRCSERRLACERRMVSRQALLRGYRSDDAHAGTGRRLIDSPLTYMRGGLVNSLLCRSRDRSSLNPAPCSTASALSRPRRIIRGTAPESRNYERTRAIIRPCVGYDKVSIAFIKSDSRCCSANWIFFF